MFWPWILLLAAALLSLPPAFAQPTSAPPAQDPLMMLMLSQPRIEVDGPVTATAVFDPPVVRSGDTAVYRVVLNALEASIEWPGEIPAEEGLHLRAGGRGQILQMSATNMQPRTTYLYRARPDSLGRFVIPDYTIKAYGKEVTVPAASLEVTPRPPAGVGQAQGLLLELPGTNLFVGQSVYAKIMYPGEPGGAVQGLAQVQMNGDGVIADLGAARQRIEAVRHRETMVPTYIYEAPLTPVTAGKLRVSAQGYSIGNRFSGPIVISGPAVLNGGIPQYVLLDSEPVEFEARPLPVEGRLPGFSGAVGAFAVEPPRLDSYELRVGEPAKIRVSVRGQGNLSRLIAPPPPNSKEWQVFAASSDNLPPQIVQAQGFVTFNYTIVPLTAAATQTPAIPFSYFDPVREKYVDATIPSVPVKVSPGKAPAQPEVLARAEALENKQEPELALIGLAAAPGRTVGSLMPAQQRAWFPLVQLAPGLFFLGLYGWDRRRRFLAAHPEIVRRRRARRALRRQRRVIDRALRAGDAPQFASAAVEALRIVSAPHYPAEPRALVCADVVPLLPASETNGQGEAVVRKIFAVHDAAQFGSVPPVNGELLALHGEFEQVLVGLEAKL